VIYPDSALVHWITTIGARLEVVAALHLEVLVQELPSERKT